MYRGLRSCGRTRKVCMVAEIFRQGRRLQFDNFSRGERVDWSPNNDINVIDVASRPSGSEGNKLYVTNSRFELEHKYEIPVYHDGWRQNSGFKHPKLWASCLEELDNLLLGRCAQSHDSELTASICRRSFDVVWRWVQLIST